MALLIEGSRNKEEMRRIHEAVMEEMRTNPPPLSRYMKNQLTSEDLKIRYRH